jgi:PAS domain S-box-containing protein
MTDSALIAGLRREAVEASVAELRRVGGPWFSAMTRSRTAIAVSDPRLPDNPVVFVNPAFTSLSGYGFDDIVGRNGRIMQGAGADPEAIRAINEAVASGSAIETTILNHRRDGGEFWNGLSLSPIIDESGQVRFFLSTHADVTPSRKDVASVKQQAEAAETSQIAHQRLRMTLSVSGAAAAWEWRIPERRIVGDLGFAALYGLTPEEAAQGVSPQKFFTIIDPQDRDRIRLAVGGMLRGAELLSKEYRVSLADGTIRWVHAKGRCHYDDQDRPTVLNGVLTDITDQKRVEEQLRIAQTAGGVGTFEHIDGFGTVSVSSQFCNLLGLRSSPVLPVRTVNAVVYPGDAPIIDVADHQPGATSRVEFRIRRPDTGEVRWLMRRGEYLRDAETAGIRFSGVVYDITDAKRTEEELRMLNETLESRVEERTKERDRIWRVSRDIYVLCAMDGRCKSANPAWQTELGYAATEVHGRSWVEFVHPDDRKFAEAATLRLERGDYVDNLDMRMLRKNGDCRWFSWTLLPEGDAFFGAGRDITHRNQLEEQLRQSQKMEAIGQLTGGIAHDFNNLLTGIIASLDIVQRRIGQGRFEKLDRMMDAASTSAQRAAALTHRLLAFSRRQSLDVRAIDINALVASMEDLLHRTLGEQIELDVRLETGLWLGLSDANQLESALLNLAINARDAMPEGGVLTIETRNRTVTRDDGPGGPDLAAGGYVVIRVSDTGMGMSPEIAAKAFDPFFTTKPIGQGTGLGLSMIYGFAKQSGGHVRIESEPGRGSTIELFVPRFVGSAAAEGVFAAPDPLPQAHGETVLVVEDDPAVRLLILELLDELGYRTLEATDSRSAIPVLESSARIDLVISDVGLPGMDGRQLADIARKVRPRIKILLVTGYAPDASLQSSFLGAGMQMMLKPFAVDILANKIREMLQ